ncbi:MAG: gliding motility-associated C-terminal domain-containing protein [Chitinophagales bacterium]
MKFSIKYGLLLVFSFFLLQVKVKGQSTIPANLLCVQTEINGDVTVIWSASAEACGPFVEYQVYASTNFAGPYVLLSSLPGFGSNTYTHIGANGAVTTWYYYVVAVYNCPGFTMTTSDTLDNLDPIAPELDYVTVTAGQSVINWIPSVSPETNSYVIYREGIGFTPIATVYGRFTTTYTDISGSPTTQSENYTIAARDSCGNIGPFNNAAQHTVFLNVSQVNCSSVLQLSWNLYDNWTAGVFEYEIWVDRNFTGSVPVDDVSNITNTYDLIGINDGDNVCITVQAKRADGTAVSVSNEVCMTVSIVNPAAYTVIRNVTVNSATQIGVEWYPDNAADLEKVSVQRSDNNITYVNLTTTPIGAPIPVIDSYNDNSIATNAISFYYRIITIDSCDIPDTSGYARSIVLKGIDNANFTNTINWNQFEITDGTVLEYRIYRDDGAGLNLINTVSALTLTYTDDVSAFVNVVDQFCYRIECLFRLNSPENGVDEQLLSYSNILCLEQGPRIYVPNAIVPDGVNTIFKPVLIYGTEEGYNMKIFNRYGEVIFETDDVNEGWDGTYNNKTVEMGAYAYLITFIASNGQVITKKGNVTVVR